MKISTVNRQRANAHYRIADPEGDGEVVIGWRIPDHVDLVGALQVGSKINSARSEVRGLYLEWLEEAQRQLPDHQKEIEEMITHFIEEESDLEEFEPSDKLEAALARYRVKRPEPSVMIPQGTFIEMCSLVENWIVNVSGLTDDNGNPLEWSALGHDIRMDFVRWMGQESVMEIYSQAFESASLDEDVKND